MYVVMVLRKDITIVVNGDEHTVPLSWSEGMTGAMPVFATREHAERYANGTRDVFAIKFREKESL